MFFSSLTTSLDWRLLVDSLNISVQIDLDKVEIILLKSLEVPDTVACICNCAVTFSLQADAQSGQIDMTSRLLQATVGVANYLHYVGEGATSNHMDEYLMSPTEMELVGVVLGGRQKFNLRFSDIYVSISPHMVNIVLGIISTMSSFNSNIPQNDMAVMGVITGGGLPLRIGDNQLATPSTFSTGEGGGDAPADFLLPKPIDRQSGWFAQAAAAASKNLLQVKTSFSNFGDLKGKKEVESLPKNQIITISVDKICLLIKNGGSQSAALPLIRFSLKLRARLADGVRFTFLCPLLIDYFNMSIFAWEPLLEPVGGVRPLDIEGEVLVIPPLDNAQNPHHNSNPETNKNLESTIKVTLTIAETMEILITKSAIRTLTTAVTEFTSELFNDGTTSHEKGKVALPANPMQLKYYKNRIIVYNFLGIPLKVDLTKSDLSVFELPSTTSSRHYSDNSSEEEKGKVIDGTLVINSGKNLSLITTDFHRNSAIINLHVSLVFGSSEEKEKENKKERNKKNKNEGNLKEKEVIVQRLVNCSNTAIRCYMTTVTNEAYSDDPWKWIVQVQEVSSNVPGSSAAAALGPSGKEVIFRSNVQIDNYFDIPMRLFTFDGVDSELLGVVGGNASYYLPLSVVYGTDMVYLRPTLEYEISDAPVDWRVLNAPIDGEDEEQFFQLSSLFNCFKGFKIKNVRHWSPLKSIICHCEHKKNPSKKFTVKVCGEKIVVFYGNTENLNFDEAYVFHLKLVPLVRLRNLLPYQMQFSYNSLQILKKQKPEFINLNIGEEKILPYADFGKTHITYQVLHYLDRSWSTVPQLLSKNECKNEDHFYTFFELPSKTLAKTTSKKHFKKKKQIKKEVALLSNTITLAVKFLVQNHSLTLSVFAPYWVINQTEEDLVYKIYGRLDDPIMAKKYPHFSPFFRHPKLMKKLPYLLAFNPSTNPFSEVDSSPTTIKKDVKLMVSIQGSYFSEPFPLNVVPFSGSLHSKSAKQDFSFDLSVRVELAHIGVSKIVTLSSFYNVYNISRRVVEFSETGGRVFSPIASSCSKVFFPRKMGDEKKMCFRFQKDPPSVFSMFVSLRSSSQTLLPIGETDFLFVEVDLIEGVEAKIKLSDYFYGAAPVLVINDLPVAIYYGQRLKTGDSAADKNKPESKAAKVGSEVKRKLTTCVSDSVARDEQDQESGCFTLLPAKHTAFYCWADPQAPRELVYRLPGEKRGRKGKTRINLDFDRYETMEFHNDDRAGVKKEFWWITFFDGKQRVLCFTDDRQLPQLLLNNDELSKPTFSLELIIKGIGIDLVDDKRKRDLLYLTVQSSFVWEESLNVKDDDDAQLPAYHEVSPRDAAALEKMYQVYRSYNVVQNSSNKSTQKNIFLKQYEAHFGPGEPMQLLAPRQARLRRTSRRGLTFSYAASAHITQYYLEVASLQVDNQLPEHIFPVAFSPVKMAIYPVHSTAVQQKIDKKALITQPSFFEFVAIVQSMTSVTRYKNVQVLVQEFSIRVDWGWIAEILALLNIVDVGIGGGDGDYVSDSNRVPGFSTRMLIYQDLDTIIKNNTLLEMQKFVMRKTYYDYLLFGPLKAHISVSVGSLPPDGRYPFGIDFIIRFTGLTVGDISDSLLRLDSFKRKRLSCSDAELVSQIIGHYKTQVYAQLYKLFLGLDILGNPMKLALGIRKGFSDFFYQPATGACESPEAFIDGLAVGVNSLTANVIGGTAAALGRIGHRLGTGLAALTINERFQRERRERLATRRPCIAEAARCLLSGLANGVSGLVRQPLEGLGEEDRGASFGGRLEAFLKGIGRGAVGTVLQPATGVVDCGTVLLLTFHGLIDPVGAAAAAGALPVRPPRHFPGASSRNHRLTAYSLYAAQGNEILRGVLESSNGSSNKYSAGNDSYSNYSGDEEYEYHLQISTAQNGGDRRGSSSLILLTSRRLLHLSRSTFFSSTSEFWKVDWAEEWTGMKSVAREGNRLTLMLEKPSQTQDSGEDVDGLCSSLWFCSSSGSSTPVMRMLVDADAGHIDDLYEKIQRHLTG